MGTARATARILSFATQSIPSAARVAAQAGPGGTTETADGHDDARARARRGR